MPFLILLLMLAMVLVCVALILLVLIQLPKKDAGVGVAFGGGATDALFGAGSGNVLTKATKWFAVVFFALALMVGFLQSHFGEKGRAASITGAVDDVAAQLTKDAAATPAVPAKPPGTTPAAVPATPPPTAPATTTPATTPPTAPATGTPASK